VPRYLAGRNRVDGSVDIEGSVEASDIDEALRKAQERWPGCGVMPPCAVAVWMRRGAALNEARQRAAVEVPA
jgi:hypothetical protein